MMMTVKEVIDIYKEKNKIKGQKQICRGNNDDLTQVQSPVLVAR